MEGFNFSGQHDARIRSENSTVTIVSFFNNAWDELGRQEASADVSSALEVALDTSTSHMTATLLNRWQRPDGQHSLSRGNTQILSNHNVFVGWARQGYISEFAADDGRCVLEAKWAADRFGTYRAYKFNFTGSPTEPPALKTFAYSSGDRSQTTAFIYYVSWNGATEVASWNFYGAPNRTTDFLLVGSVPKKEFETIFMSTEYVYWTFAEAVALDGKSLGNSSVQRPLSPNGAHGGFQPFTIADAVHEGGALLMSSASPVTSTVLVTSTVAVTNTVLTTRTTDATSTGLVTSALAASSIVPVSNTEENPADDASPLTVSLDGPMAVVFIVIISCFAFAGTVMAVSFLWNRRCWLSRGVYSPLTASSDTLDGGEMDDLSYQDEEAEKSGESGLRGQSRVKRTD